MKVQLLIPRGGYSAERWSKGSSMPPLGILYIASVLEKEGFEVQVVPSDILNLSKKQIENEILDFKPDIIGITSVTENRFQSFKLIKLAKKTHPSALTVLGGPHASMAAEDCLSHTKELDVVVRGEGEMTMLELCRVLNKTKKLSSIAKIHGISIKFNGQIRSNPPRIPITDLDSLPFPAFHLIPFKKYHFFFDVPGKGSLPAANIMTSRGCPFNCNFCATPINWGRRVRTRSPQNVIDEIEFMIQKYGVRVIFFYDDTFNASPKRLEQICDLIIERNLPIFWKCDIRLDLINKALLTKMKKAGLFHLSFGLEAGSERVRNTIVGKRINIEDFHQVIRWCHELDIIPNAFFIFSHPTETWEEAQETIKIIEQYKNSIEASIAILHVYPGTPLEKTAKELGVIPEDFSWSKKYHSKIITLPKAQGDVPLFHDKLTWTQISKLTFRWSLSGGKFSICHKIPGIIMSIHSFGDLRRHIIMAFVYLKLKIKNLLERNKKK